MGIDRGRRPIHHLIVDPAKSMVPICGERRIHVGDFWNRRQGLTWWYCNQPPREANLCPQCRDGWKAHPDYDEWAEGLPTWLL